MPGPYHLSKGEIQVGEGQLVRPERADTGVCPYILLVLFVYKWIVSHSCSLSGSIGTAVMQWDDIG